MKIEARVAAGVKGVKASWAAKVVSGVLKAERSKAKSAGAYVTNDKEIRRINKQFLNHDYATDVIAFNLDEMHLGDVVVSVDTARRTAAELKLPYKEELARYLVHGTLHLLGYRDKKKADKVRMHKRQEALLVKMKLKAK
jgi:probable rRNA maturation factor